MKRILYAFFSLLLLAGCAGRPAPEFTEREVVIGADPWQLPGTLTLPKGAGPFPVVVFVHGSGPADRDETVGVQTLFKDLAANLAALGVATLRYDKRTLVHQSAVIDDAFFTVKEESIDDALAAVSLALSENKLDASRIYVAGHSLGGYLLPRIDQADEEIHIAGYISLAGNARPIMELLAEQTEYILSLELFMPEKNKETQRQQVATAKAAVDALTEADKGDMTAIFGAYPAYWLDLAGYNPAESAKTIVKPMLFLQGGHDYQVTATDFALWQEALAGKENAVFIFYDDLTHSFVKTARKSIPADYYLNLSADRRVSADIQAFIAGNP